MCMRVYYSKVHGDTKTDSNMQSSSPLTGYLINGRSLTLPGRTSPASSSVCSQSVGVHISSTHSLSLPNLQQHCADAASFISDTVNTEWVSLMTSMNLGEVSDVDSHTESRSVYLGVVVVVVVVQSNLQCCRTRICDLVSADTLCMLI